MPFEVAAKRLSYIVALVALAFLIGCTTASRSNGLGSGSGGSGEQEELAAEEQEEPGEAAAADRHRVLHVSSIL